jgi:ABC-type sugar transport system ATPase subunit
VTARRHHHEPSDAIALGLAFRAGGRAAAGHLPHLSVEQNITAAGPAHRAAGLHRRAGNGARLRVVKKLRIGLRRCASRSASSPAQPAEGDPGRWLLTDPSSYPRRADARIDIGVKASSTNPRSAIAATYAAILLISSECRIALRSATAFLVMSEGGSPPTSPAQRSDQESIMSAAVPRSARALAA